MSETVRRSSDAPPALPQAGTTVQLPRWLTAWLDRGAKYALLGAIGLPLLFGFLFFPMTLVAEATCQNSDGCTLPITVFLIIQGTLVLLWLLSLATLVGGSAARSTKKEHQASFEPLLQGAKDWFVRGDITEAEFEALRGVLEPSLEGKTDDIRIMRASGILTWFGVLTTIAIIPLGITTIVMAVEAFGYYAQAIEFVIFLVCLVFSLVVLFAMVTSWVGAARARRVARELVEQFRIRVRAQEELILRTAHERKRLGGPGSPMSYAGPTASPSFRSYRSR